MDFIIYTVEDFLMNESFLSYCLNDNGKDSFFWKNWIIAHPDKKHEMEKAVKLFFILSGGWSAEQLNLNFNTFQSAIRKKKAAQQSGKAQRSRSPKTIIQYSIWAMISISLLYSGAIYNNYNGKQELIRATFPDPDKSPENKYSTSLTNRTKAVPHPATPLGAAVNFHRGIRDVEGAG